MIGLIGSQFRIMYQVKLLENEGMSNNEIARILESHPYRITKTRELTKYYNLDDIGDIIVAPNGKIFYDWDFSVDTETAVYNSFIDSLKTNSIV